MFSNMKNALKYIDSRHLQTMLKNVTLVWSVDIIMIVVLIK